MEKKRFGPRKRMHGLPKASVAKVNFLSIPKEIETSFDTGYGPGNNLKNSERKMGCDLAKPCKY